MATTDRPPPINVAPKATIRRALRSTNMTTVSRGLTIRGHLSATEHVIIEGFFEGEIAIPDHELAISGAAYVNGEVWARAITVLGRVDGNLTASALIELRETAEVTGRLASPLLSIVEGALFRGRVDPTKTDTAVAVARHRLHQSTRQFAERVHTPTGTSPTASPVQPPPDATTNHVTASVVTDT